jgi:hypothetical protein
MGLANLQDLVDQFVDHVLAGWRLVGTHLGQLGAVLYIQRRDRLAIDQHNNFLGMADDGDRQQAYRCEAEGGQTPAQGMNRE